MAQQKVLVVDDESAIRDMLRMALELSGYEWLEGENIFDAHRLVLEQGPDIVLLDWMLPGGNGTELLRRLKQSQVTQDIPVIMVTAKTTEDNIIQGLDVGADDYITKPFAPRELIARIKALLRRAKPREAEETIEVAGLRLDLAARRGFINGEPLDLGPTEFKLLHFFMSHPDRAYTRGQILDHVWGTNVYVEERTVDVHIRRLRKLMQVPDGDHSKLIQTVRGTGYRFSEHG